LLGVDTGVVSKDAYAADDRVSVREPIEDGYGRATSRTMMRRVRARVRARVLARIPTSGTSGPIGADEMRRGPDGGLARRQLYTSIAYGADEAIEGREGVSLGGDALDERAIRLFFSRPGDGVERMESGSGVEQQQQRTSLLPLSCRTAGPGGRL
jgi:hypothetical protein